MTYEISVEPIFKTRAKPILMFFKTKKFFVGESYDVTLKIRNNGSTNFPGGKGEFIIKFPTDQGWVIPLDNNGELKELKAGEEIKFGPYTPGAMAEGCVMCTSHIIANDGNPVKLFDKNGNERTPRTGSFTEFFVERRADVYAKIGIGVSLAIGILAIIIAILK